MWIGFVGDIHGRVLHTLAVLCELQRRAGLKLDWIIQVGDLGAYPEPDEELLQEKYMRQDPAELDFSRFLQASGPLAAAIREVRERQLEPIHFIRGNHEDFDWLNGLRHHAVNGVVGVDPFDVCRYVTDGTVIERERVKIGFLGGIETEIQQPKSFDPEAYEKLMQLHPGDVDILVTHDAPFGIGYGYHGNPQGSAMISQLIERLQPKLLVAGHYHHVNGPKRFGPTTYLGLNVLVNLREDGELRRVQPGSIALLNTETNELRVIEEEWLASIDREFDFLAYMQKESQ